ncbi:MAG: DNA repair protein RadC [Sphaerochaetaceae bacterium]|nr:DNA repair protein RadC [Sphaerochaetaceae bacterium]
MKYETKPILFKSIKDMPKNQRPREKLVLTGAQGLKDVELLSIILRNGSTSRPVHEIAKDLLDYLSNYKGEFLKPEELCSISGVGIAAATAFCAALELGRRFSKTKGRICNEPRLVFQEIRHYGLRQQEHFLALSLNGANELMETRVITVGLVNRTLVHPREVFSEAIKNRATSIILAHNHPSGNLMPSNDDIEVTIRLKKAGNILGIEILDHIIFSEDSYYSMREKGEFFIT